MWRSRRDCGSQPHRSGAFQVSAAVDRGTVTTVYGSYGRIGADGSDPVQRGGTTGQEIQDNVQAWSVAGAAMQGRAPCLWPMAASRIRRLSRTEGVMGTGEAAHRRHRPLPTAGLG